MLHLFGWMHTQILIQTKPARVAMYTGCPWLCSQASLQIIGLICPGWTGNNQCKQNYNTFARHLQTFFTFENIFRLSIRNVAYIGLRSIDQYERLVIEKFGITAYGMEDIERYGINIIFQKYKFCISTKF